MRVKHCYFEDTVRVLRGWPKGENKPSWDDAPSWAQSFGVAIYDGSPRQWYWFSGTAPEGAECLEQRPNE